VVILLCRFVPGGRMATFFYAGRSRYSRRRFLVYESAAALGWAAYGGIVGHIGGAAVTHSAWQLVAIAAVAATLFAAAGWLLALVGAGRNAGATEAAPANEPDAAELADTATPDAEPGTAASPGLAIAEA
jgi:membrane protein DedA with SNARE-associated domain